MASAWYVARGGSEGGPFTPEQLKQLADSGRLRPAEMVWKEGTAKWVPAGSVKGLFAGGQPAATSPPPATPPVTAAEKDRPSARQSLPEPADRPPAARTGQPPVNWEQLRENVFVVLASLMLCFPLGLFLVWTHPRWGRNVKLAWTGTWAGLVLVGGVINVFQHLAAQKELAEAHRLWESGQKDEAVAKYRKGINNKSVGKADLPTVYQRVIEHEAERGDSTSARAFIQAAEKERVTLNLGGGKAKVLMDEMRRERGGKSVAQVTEPKKQTKEKTDPPKQEKEDVNKNSRPFKEGHESGFKFGSNIRKTHRLQGVFVSETELRETLGDPVRDLLDVGGKLPYPFGTPELNDWKQGYVVGLIAGYKPDQP